MLIMYKVPIWIFTRLKYSKFRDHLLMTLYSPSFVIEVFFSLIVVLSIVIFFFKNRKRSAKNIYKLIDDLEKKYIHPKKTIG